MGTRKLTEGALKRIIKEEVGRLVEMGPRGVAPQSYAPGAAPGTSSRFYAKKLDYLRAARDELINAVTYETREGSGEDLDLENILEGLEGYIEAVQAMADQE